MAFEGNERVLDRTGRTFGIGRGEAKESRGPGEGPLQEEFGVPRDDSRQHLRNGDSRLHGAHQTLGRTARTETNSMKSNLATCVVFACCAAVAAKGPQATPLKDVVNRLDQAAKGFRSMSAEVSGTKHTTVLNDHSTPTPPSFPAHTAN